MHLAKPAAIDLGEHLEQRVLTKFDELHAKQQIIYEVTSAEVVTETGFRFEYRVIPGFKKKPILSADDPARKQAQKGPFLPPNPNELVQQVGKTHNIIINKYATHRPMLVIPTQDFRRQTEDLDMDDIGVALALLKAFKEPSIVIYNCGVESGSSQGHKHMQWFPVDVDKLWPSRAAEQPGIISNIKDVPFQHFVTRIEADWTAFEIYDEYARSVRLAREALQACSSKSNDYNVVMSRKWIAVIPRRTAGGNGPFGSNAAGMLGLVSVPDQEQREAWARLGHAKYLTELGVPLRE